jgi:uncharacterized membrane protein YeiH
VRASTAVCLIAVITAAGGAAILDNLVEQSAAQAFAEPTARA